jgi:plastocyanin
MKKFVVPKSRLLISTVFLFAILTILNSCSKTSAYNTPSPGPGPKGGPGVNEVWIQGMAFDPTTITITSGTTIKWTNKDGVAHTVTSDTGLFDSGSIGNGGTFSMQFNNTGTFAYHCAVHPGMKATVVVN